MTKLYPERGYSTFSYDEEKRPDVFEFLRLHLEQERAAASGKEVYLLGVKGDQTRALQRDEQVRQVLVLNNTTNYVVVGDRSSVERIASELHQKSNMPVGILRYEGQDSPAVLYLDLCTAIRHGQKRNKAWHLYDSTVDSIDATVS